MINISLIFIVKQIIKIKVEDLYIDDVPSIKLYLRGEKKSPKTFNQEYTLKKLSKFILVLIKIKNRIT